MGALLDTNKIGCLADAECYGAWWKEGVSDEMKKTACCLAYQIRVIDADNAGYKERVTADKAVVKSADNAGPVTTNEVGYKYSACSTGKSGNDATKGYVSTFKSYVDAKVLNADGLTHPDVVKLTTKGSSAGLNAVDTSQGGVTWAIYCNGAQALATGAAAAVSAYISLA